eukprot:CAMPEP_0174906648 /NCGR_PEP_ID=MMETSP0167-20121228/57874_1 /TAXON_ID=38298 /ORGANISM="Rhodella maculata, Strain CCMP736" /LENGTH=41 /DNA_ID= /DNA_START= /DNA_END= /DNA_ORIENTATION=
MTDMPLGGATARHRSALWTSGPIAATAKMRLSSDRLLDSSV